jgi:hypothetical protein
MTSSRDIVFLTILGVPYAFIMIAGIITQWQGWQIYHRMGAYSIGLMTFFWQLQSPGANFPGPNVLEARIAAQSPELQAYIETWRRRRLYFSRAILCWLGLLLVVCLVNWKLSS